MKNSSGTSSEEFLFIIGDISQEFVSLNLQQIATGSIEESKILSGEAVQQNLKQAYFVDAVERLKQKS